MNMNTLKGVIRNGQVILPEAANWPDGTEVTVQLPDLTPTSQVPDDDGPLTPEEIVRILALMDQVLPFEMTAEERARWEAERKERREREKATFFEQSEELRRMWE
jgi:hypothetical protein